MASSFWQFPSIYLMIGQDKNKGYFIVDWDRRVGIQRGPFLMIQNAKFNAPFYNKQAMNPNHPQYTGNTLNTYPTSGTTTYQTTTTVHPTGYVATNVHPTGYVASHGINTGNIVYTKGELQKWNNPYGLSIPLIKFDPTCKKCHGSGVSKSRFSGTPLPCTRCYTRHGYCKKCYGTGVNYRKNKACKKCDAGKRLHNKSSSSSEDSP